MKCGAKTKRTTTHKASKNLGRIHTEARGKKYLDVKRRETGEG